MALVALLAAGGVPAAAATVAIAPAPGRAWERPRAVSLPSLFGGPEVAVARDGSAVAVWGRASYLPGTERLRLAIVEAASAGPDGVWTAPTVLSLPGQIAVWPRVASDGEGNAIAAWSAPEGVWAAERLAGGAWGRARQLSAPGAAAGGVALALNDAGSGAILWQRAPDGGTSLVEASVRGGDGVWGPLRTLSAADENAAYPSVAIDGDGTVTAVWLRVDDGLVRVRAATARDGAWSAPQDISAAVASRTGYPPAPPQVAAGPGGRAAAIWTLAGRGGEGAVQTAILVPGAGWEAPAMLAPRQRRPREPRVAIDGAGTALAAWDDDDGAVRVAARPVGAPWEQPVVVSRAPGRACGASLHPRLAAGAAGEAVVAWHELTPRGNVLQVAERVGGAWSTPRDLSLPGGQLPSLAIAANGEGLAVWAAVQGRRERALVQSSRRPVVALPPDSGLPQPPHPALSGLRLLGASAAGVRVSFRLTRAARLRVSNEPLDGQRGLLLIREQAARGGVNRLLLRPMTGRLAPGRYRLTLHAEQGTRTSCSASLTYLVLGRIAPT